MSRRDQVRMSDEEIRAFLDQSLTIIISSIGRDGVPHPIPMWYAIEDDGAIVMSTYTKSQKIRNLRRDPRVSLLVEDGTVYSELRGVLMYGVAELVQDVEPVTRTCSWRCPRGRAALKRATCGLKCASPPKSAPASASGRTRSCRGITASSAVYIRSRTAGRLGAAA